MAEWWSLPVLSAEGLDHIANHKYKPGKYTPLDNLLNGWWQGLTNLLPMSLAPNLVTFSGFLPMVAMYAMVFQYSPGEPVPRSLAFFAGGALFFYQTMDAMDGKQARRTKSSTPLGQLFDHGCDCLACLSHHTIAAFCLLPGKSLWGIGGLCGLQTGFFFAQWQEMYTGVLRTSYGCVGVTETQYGLIFAAVSAGLLGPDKYSELASTLIDILGMRVPAGIVGVAGWVAFCSVLILTCILKTTKHIFENPDADLKLNGQPLIHRALLDLVPIVMLNIFALLWEESLFALYPRTIFLLTGLLFFYFTVQMIVYSMARMVYPAWQPCLFPYVAMVILAKVFPRAPHVVGFVLQLVTAGTAGAIMVWLLKAISELKQRLGIKVFKIEEKKE